MAYLTARGQHSVPIDISRFFWADHNTDKAVRTWPAKAELATEGTLILHVNPDQLTYVLSILPPELIARKYIIEYLVWEFAQIPTSWKASLKIVDEIWVPSSFVSHALIASGVDKPIVVVPHILQPPSRVSAVRNNHGFGDNCFLVLCAFNLRSGLKRKNVRGAVEAFKSAFGDDDNTCLILKCHDAHIDPGAQTEIESFVRKNIKIISDDLSDNDMWSLISSCDCILSLHRSEGFGLVLKQGLMLDKPVIATGWSGNLDFMTDDKGTPLKNCYLVPYKLVPAGSDSGVFGAEEDFLWAEPDISAASVYLRDLYNIWAAQHGHTN